MNPFAYRTTGLAINVLSRLFRANIRIHGRENLPKGAIIFVVNHFTRVETLFLPYYFYHLAGKTPIWSLADYGLFKGSLGRFLDQVGAVSTRNPDRDRLIVKTLLTGEAAWIIFPEGRMVKNKKIVEKGRFVISYAGAKHPPHTGAAVLALRTEFYRQRLKTLIQDLPDEANRLLTLFGIENVEAVLSQNTFIVPVNVTYYPIRARQNALSSIAQKLVEELPHRTLDELMTEGTMLLAGVDVDIRLGKALPVLPSLGHAAIRRDIGAREQINFDDPLPCRKRMRREALKLMQQYMGAIYGMTTVNHDHLFASVLKLAPVSRWTEADFRRRIFLSLIRDLDTSGIHFHESLKDSQYHLLVDDRFQKYDDFIQLAVDTGVVRRQESALERIAGKFDSFLDFHRIRIDNPVAVIANEVEPLTRLKRHLQRIAWTPSFLVRRQIARMLHRQALAEFQEDRLAHRQGTETQKKSVGKPLLIKGKSRRLGVLLVHGYMAAPMEVKSLADYLGRRGFWVYAPRLKGHGTAPEDLAECSYGDWIESVEAGYAIISSLCTRVVIGGFSMGAGLALHLAARISDLAGVFAVATPLRLQYVSARFVPAVDVWNRLMKSLHLNGVKKDFVENHPENPDINYTRNPVAGIRELERLMAAVEPLLPRIQVPALVVHSQGDPVVDPKGSRRIFEQLGSRDKSCILFNLQRHGILLGEGSERVHESIAAFVTGLRK